MFTSSIPLISRWVVDDSTALIKLRKYVQSGDDDEAERMMSVGVGTYARIVGRRRRNPKLLREP